MQFMPGICEKCKRVFKSSGVAFSGIGSNNTFHNIQLGTCPFDGGRIMGVSGVYSHFDDHLSIDPFENSNEVKKILSVLDNITVHTPINEIEKTFKEEFGEESVILDFFYKVSEVTNNTELLKKFMMFILSSLIGYGLNEAFDEIKEKVTETPTEKLQQEFEQFKSRSEEENKKIIEQNQILIQQNKELISQQKNLLDCKKKKSTIVQKKKAKWKKSRNTRR
ncbi:hypothetical protein QNJ39_03915 [Macrococcus caseolyticus]|uniref:hypothetical protein n=1 Tax=Macrococcoides caseolyticum TaxID=69966 RepID=UPI0024BBF20E|nr:hypothetical protein [Macrococcus caseolyticus]MDJ1090731.1 hypothetical protein [Macrococcus caseolyticus]